MKRVPGCRRCSIVQTDLVRGEAEVRAAARYLSRAPESERRRDRLAKAKEDLARKRESAAAEHEHDDYLYTQHYTTRTAHA